MAKLQRLTNDDVKEQFPCLYGGYGDNAAAIMYGDLPAEIYNEELYQTYAKLSEKDSHIANVHGVKQYIYKRIGEYHIYKTFRGDIYTNPQGQVINADITVMYRGRMYKVFFSNMYGEDKFGIMYYPYGDGVSKVWTNANFTAHMPRCYEKMDIDIARDILSAKNVYGKSYNDALAKCRELIDKDSVNYGKVMHI